jgi:hypothetical protein
METWDGCYVGIIRVAGIIKYRTRPCLTLEEADDRIERALRILKNRYRDLTITSLVIDSITAKNER